MRTVEIYGAGLAGSFLHHHLQQAGVACRFYGKGETNTPPVGFVHLFQGRTFHRQAVEVEAYERAVDFWRAEVLAEEWRVRRTVSEGGRLHRSASTDTVPKEFRPHQVEALIYEYGPGFTVSAGKLVERFHTETGAPQSPPVQAGSLRVLALGTGIQERLPELRWDTNPGRTVEGYCPEEPDKTPSFLTLHRGLHMGGNPHGGGFTLGGRVNSKGEAKNDEADMATSILSQAVELRSEWWGERIANALDRWPLVGWLNEEEFVFAGFGGRALFWLPYCVEIAARALQEGSNETIPESLRPDRFR